MKWQVVLVWVMVVLIVLFIVVDLITTVGRELRAQEMTRDVPPYEIGRVGSTGRVFKMVYQGCELFIVEGHVYGSDTAYAIATGRGCGK
jgi:hypothetical protein